MELADDHFLYPGAPVVRCRRLAQMEDTIIPFLIRRVSRLKPHLGAYRREADSFRARKSQGKVLCGSCVLLRRGCDRMGR